MNARGADFAGVPARPGMLEKRSPRRGTPRASGPLITADRMSRQADRQDAFRRRACKGSANYSLRNLREEFARFPRGADPNPNLNPHEILRTDLKRVFRGFLWLLALRTAGTVLALVLPRWPART
jgi:hypothetical protein